MVYLKVQITKITSLDFPVFVECQFKDVHNKIWVIQDKAPIFTNDDIDADTQLPHPGVIRCEVVEKYTDASGKEVIKIDTNKPDGVATADEVHIFEVYSNQISDVV